MNKIYKTILSVIVLSIISIQTKAQLAGTYSVPATFSTIAAAINSLNIAGVSGTVTILINAGHTETVPVGGFSMTATGTALNPIIFQKNGAGTNPLLVAYAGGTATPASAVQDGVWRLIGSDYVTIDGINISDPNSANPATMEFGYGLFKANATDGCQNNIIKNCVITMNRDNNAMGILPAAEGSRGIDVVNSLSDAHTTPLTIASSAGANSNNSFRNNLIQNCNIAVSLIGYADFSPYANADVNNDIGGTLAATGNTLINYGGGTLATNPAAAVNASAQYSLNVSYNTINSNNGNGINHPSTLRGIYVNSAPNSVTTINNNTVTINGGGTTSQLMAIYNISGSSGVTNTVSINNNLITNCTYTTATSGTFYGIWNQGAPYALAINNNTLINNSTNATFGSYYNIYNSGSVTNSISITNNLVNLGTFSANATSATLYGIYSTGGSVTTTLSLSSNTLQNSLSSGTRSGSSYLLYLGTGGLVGSSNITSNIFDGLSMNSSGTVYFLYSYNGYNNLISGNTVVNGFSKNLTGGTVYGLYCWGGTTGTSTMTANSMTNFTLAGSQFYGLYHSTSSTQTTVISNNTVSAISNPSTTSTSYGLLAGYYANVSNNLIGNISAGGTIYGFYGSTNSNPNALVYSNTISALSTTNTGVYGYYSISTGTTSIYNNKIYDIQSTNQFPTSSGMYFTSGTNYRIFNNIVGDIKAPNANTGMPVTGIYIAGGSTYNLFYNSVYLNTTSSGALFGSAALYSSTTPSVNLRNNILINNSVPNGLGFTVGYWRSSTSLTTYSSTSNNNIFYAGTPGPNNLIFYNGITGYQTLGAFQALVTPRDNVSQTENTPFLSIVGTNTNFLHVDPTSPSLAESGAVNITGITNDFDTDIRQGNGGYTGSGTAPDIGADEFNSNVVNCNLVGPAAVTPTAVLKCDAQTATLSASGYTTGNGISQQWQVSNTPGGPYSNVVGGNGGNYPLLYTTSTLSPNTYYYVLLTTCAISGQTAVSNEGTVTVLPYPTLTVTPNTSTMCVPGANPATLTASGALSYTWLPAAGLNGTVGVSVNALPGATTIYTVTGVNAAGCSSVITTTVTVLEGPSIVNLAATPSIVCSGGNSSLQVLGALTNSYSISGLNYSPIPTPSVGVTTLCSNSVAVTPLNTGNLNDGAWTNLQIPFFFNFFGVSYTSFAVGTNGFITLGSGNPNTVFGTGVAFPNTGAARPSIAAVYGNLNWTTPGSIQVFTTGVAPNRKVVVNWTNGAFSLNTGTVTAQAILHESSNNIDVHTFQNTGNATAVQGIQNASGTAAYTIPNRNAFGSWTVTIPDAYRFSPNEGPISYTWTPSTYLTGTNIPNPVANTVTAGITYSAIVSATNGCSSTGTLSLIADITPTVTIVGTNSICTNNTLNLTANGAATYSWSNGATNATIATTPTSNVTYSVVGTSSLGCTDDAVHSVTVNVTPTIAVSGPSNSCSGSSINLIATGADTYSWSNGSTLSVIAPSPTSNVTYSVIGTTTAGCASSEVSKSVTVYALPTVTITVRERICIGEPVTIISSGTGVDTYSWNTGANAAVIVESPTVNTSYTVTVTNNNTGCSNTATTSITVDPCVGLNELNSTISGLSLYPNPNSGIFTIELSNGKEKAIEISDITGRVIMMHTFNSDKINVDVRELANGIYYVKTLSDNSIQISRIIKQ